MEESLHCLTHPAALLPAMDLLIDLDRLLRAFRRTIHILHLLLDQVHLPIELVEHNMEGVEHTLVSVGLDRLELLLVTVVPTMLVCSVSLAREEESIERFCREREYSEHSLVQSRQFDSVLSAQSCTCSPPDATSSQTSLLILSISVWSSWISALYVDC